jgi:hypothetical protein
MRWMPILLLAACGPRNGTPPTTGPEAPPPPHSDGGVAPQPRATTDGGVAIVPPPVRPPAAPRPAKIKLTIKSVPPKSWVFWGKEKLGQTPVQLERPRDSGPVDIVVKNDGFLTLHTRLYTVRNETLVVRLVKVADRMTVLGAKAELPPENPDGGAPPPPPP